MAKMITAKNWHFFKEKFPDSVSDMKTVVVPAESWQLKSYWKKNKSNIITQQAFTQADPVGAMVGWCEETLADNFYAEKSNSNSSWITSITFYFFDEDDAVFFKLTWW